jgi:multiple sugar transport system ATP-binding protein
MTMADKIVVMNAGRIEQIGTPFEIYDRPVNTFVAGFLGSPAMNLIKGKVSGGTKPNLDLGGGLVLPLPLQAKALEGRDIVLGVRPENVDIIERGGLAAKVTSIEPTGSDTLIGVEFAGHAFTSVLHRRVDLELGQAVQILLKSEALHYFDAATQNRI